MIAGISATVNGQKYANRFDLSGGLTAEQCYRAWKREFEDVLGLTADDGYETWVEDDD